jgi:hypothetical protein
LADQVLDHEQPLARTVLHQDRIDTPPHLLISPNLHVYVLGLGSTAANETPVAR